MSGHLGVLRTPGLALSITDALTVVMRVLTSIVSDCSLLVTSALSLAVRPFFRQSTVLVFELG